ncbi:MAG: pitrilysin family protein, partial [Acidobacteria bacterium]|nr:pitrilysin family protein [Acidobacteriota bacterium]
FRTVLANGLVVYIAEDHEIPWVDATLLSPVISGGGGAAGRGGRAEVYGLPQRGGGGGGGSRSFLEPPDKLGVQALTGTVVRTGGSMTMTGEQLNERMDFLAGSVTATSLSLHVRHLDEGLKIWLDLLNNPAFPDDRLQREKQGVLPAIRNRNRNISTVAGGTFQRLVYGDDSPIVAEPTEATINGITRADLVAWHKKYWGANNAILVIAGDFKKAEMLQKLEATFGKWRNAEKAAPAWPKPEQITKAGVYMVQPQGITPNQGIILIGHIGLTRDDPDYPAVDLMNYTLGGGSFSSRITKIVRTDNGLAYTTNSSFLAEMHYPGTFQAFCQTKNETVVFAAQLMINEIERMRAGDVTEQDLKSARAARLSAFPAMFSTTAGNVRNFASLELEGRPMDYYEAYEARYSKVTLADIKRVAQTYLRPDKLVIMVAGNIEECKAGAGTMLPNQGTIDAMAAKYGGRTIDGLAKKFGDGTVHIVTLK